MTAATITAMSISSAVRVVFTHPQGHLCSNRRDMFVAQNEPFSPEKVSFFRAKIFYCFVLIFPYICKIVNCRNYITYKTQ